MKRVLYNPYGKWEPSKKAILLYNSLASTNLVSLDTIPRDDPILLQTFLHSPHEFKNIKIEECKFQYFYIEVDEYGRESVIEDEYGRESVVEDELKKENARLQEISNNNPMLYSGVSNILKLALIKTSKV